MKKSLIIFAMAAFIVACNDSGNKADAKDGDANTNSAQSADAGQGAKLAAGVTQEEYDQGLNLVATSDCLTCHQINQKITGPSYAEIAAKYEPTKENITMLAGKIIKGGSGNWGQIPMTPHPDVKQEEAELMVKYVLSLKQ